MWTYFIRIFQTSIKRVESEYVDRRVGTKQTHWAFKNCRLSVGPPPATLAHRWPVLPVGFVWCVTPHLYYWWFLRQSPGDAGLHTSQTDPSHTPVSQSILYNSAWCVRVCRGSTQLSPGPEPPLLCCTYRYLGTRRCCDVESTSCAQWVLVLYRQSNLSIVFGKQTEFMVTNRQNSCHLAFLYFCFVNLCAMKKWCLY